MNRKRIIIIAGVAVIAVAALSYALLINRNNGDENYVMKPVEMGDIQRIVVATGALNPVTTVEVGSQVSGRIEKLFADFNSRVKEGDIVAQLDQSLFITRVRQSEANYKSSAASLEKAKVNLDNSKKALDRIKDLFSKGFASPQEKDKAEETYYTNQAEVKAAEARLEQALAQLESNKVDLQHTIINSPIDGVVISRNVNVGQTVAASFQAPVLFEIANNLSKMQINCNVDEADIGSIREGQKATFTVDAFPEEVFQAQVVQVRFAPIIVQNVVTYDTIIEVNNPELKLKPGMTATVSIVVDERKGILKVPNSALRFTPNLSPDEVNKLMEELDSERAQRREGRDDASPRRGEGQGKYSQAQGSNRPQMQRGQLSSNTGNFTQRRQPSFVWIFDEKNKLKPIGVVTGLSDANFTEVVRGRLEKNQMVITGVETSMADSSGGSSPFGPPWMRRRSSSSRSRR